MVIVYDEVADCRGCNQACEGEEVGNIVDVFMPDGVELKCRF